jgi:SRSO17 transposase
MLPPATVPASLLEVLAPVRLCFTAPTFATFAALVTGALSVTGSATVTGMCSAAGLAGKIHWSRAHRFFSAAVWDLDQLGLALARMVVNRFLPRGAAVTVAVDDSLFHRFGTKVHGVAWQHDGAATGRDGIGRGNCFVIAGIVVTVAFLARALCLPTLARLHVPKRGPSKTETARALVDLVASAFPARRIHVVADALYRGPAWRDLPTRVTFTTRLAANAVLYGLEPPRSGKRGHPRWQGERLGTPAELAAGAAWHPATVTIYGKTTPVHLAQIRCLWWGSLHRTPVTVVLMRKATSTRAYDWALVSTDLAASPEQIVARYASRWGIEQSIKDSKDLLGAGDAQSRLKKAVERTVPFVLTCQSILILWYAHTGQIQDDLTARRAIAPWYRHKHHVSVADMITAFRRARISEATAGQADPPLFARTSPTSQATAA